MKIASISLQNFKSYRKPQKILFGMDEKYITIIGDWRGGIGELKLVMDRILVSAAGLSAKREKDFNEHCCFDC